VNLIAPNIIQSTTTKKAKTKTTEAPKKLTKKQQKQLSTSSTPLQISPTKNDNKQQQLIQIDFPKTSTPLNHQNIQPKIALPSNKPRAIRPKPPAPLQQHQHQSNLINIITKANQTNSKYLTVNTAQSYQHQPINMNLVSSTPTSTLVDNNDILSKAASMIFSPSEFNLNNISPSHNTNNNSDVKTPTKKPKKPKKQSTKETKQSPNTEESIIKDNTKVSLK
jgi:hypothetical protein